MSLESNPFNNFNKETPESREVDTEEEPGKKEVIDNFLKKEGGSIEKELKEEMENVVPEKEESNFRKYLEKAKKKVAVALLAGTIITGSLLSSGCEATGVENQQKGEINQDTQIVQEVEDINNLEQFTELIFELEEKVKSGEITFSTYKDSLIALNDNDSLRERLLEKDHVTHQYNSMIDTSMDQFTNNDFLDLVIKSSDKAASGEITFERFKEIVQDEALKDHVSKSRYYDDTIVEDFLRITKERLGLEASEESGAESMRELEQVSEDLNENWISGYEEGARNRLELYESMGGNPDIESVIQEEIDLGKRLNKAFCEVTGNGIEFETNVITEARDIISDKLSDGDLSTKEYVNIFNEMGYTVSEDSIGSLINLINRLENNARLKSSLSTTVENHIRALNN